MPKKNIDTNAVAIEKTYTPIIAAITEKRTAMQVLQEKDKKQGDSYLNGYHHGIQDGLDSAIEIVKEIEAAQYRKLTTAACKKARKELSKSKKRIPARVLGRG